ncbi:50S ribosomal protein HLP, mitochondrial-like protein [Tanacetum coccineum]
MCLVSQLAPKGALVFDLAPKGCVEVVTAQGKCPSVLGGDTYEGYIFITAGCSWRGHLRGPHIHYCSDVLGEDTLSGVGSIRRIQSPGYDVLGFLGVGTTFDIFQNIHLLYLQYHVLIFSGYDILILFPSWSLVGNGTFEVAQNANKDSHTNEIQSESGRQLRGKTIYVHTSFEGEERCQIRGHDSNISEGSLTRRKSKERQVVYGVVVRAAMQKGRCDGSEVKFDDNAVILINKQGKPIGTRVFGPVPHELRKKKHVKILSLAQHIA